MNNLIRRSMKRDGAPVCSNETIISGKPAAMAISHAELYYLFIYLLRKRVIVILLQYFYQLRNQAF